MSERSEILEMMSSLELGGMRAAYDDIVTVGIKRQHSIEKRSEERRVGKECA